MGNKAYLISVATALALGYSAGFASNNITAKAAISMSEKGVWTTNVLTSVPQIASIWGDLELLACDDIDSKLGLDPGTCANQMDPCTANSSINLTCNADGTTSVSAGVQISGTWTPGAAQ